MLKDPRHVLYVCVCMCVYVCVWGGGVDDYNEADSYICGQAEKGSSTLMV